VPREERGDERGEVLVHVGGGGGERRHDLLVERADDLLELPAGRAHIVDLGVELAVALLEHRELLQRQWVDEPEGTESFGQVRRVLRRAAAGGQLGARGTEHLVGRAREVVADHLGERVGAQRHLGDLEVVDPGALAHLLEARLGARALEPEVLEALPAGAHGRHLAPVVRTQGLEHRLEALPLPFEEGTQTHECTPVGLEALTARLRGLTLFCVALEAPLHLGPAPRQHPAALLEAGRADLERLASGAQLGTALLEDRRGARGQGRLATAAAAASSIAGIASSTSKKRLGRLLHALAASSRAASASASSTANRERSTPDRERSASAA